MFSVVAMEGGLCGSWAPARARSVVRMGHGRVVYSKTQVGREAPGGSWLPGVALALIIS